MAPSSSRPFFTRLLCKIRDRFRRPSRHDGGGSGPCGAALSLLAAGLLVAGPALATSVTFRYQPVIGGIDGVSLAGTMNDWSATATPMTDADEDGIWEVTLDLPPGSYEYKFVVGEEWFGDDYAMDARPDGFGGENSIVVVKDAAMILGPGGNVAPRGAAPDGSLRRVTFRHRPAGKPNEIVVAGTFNDWNVGATHMSDSDGDGEYEASLLLAEGDYQYKFVIDGRWTTDRDHADAFTDDGFGGENSVLVVDDRFPAMDVALGDNVVTTFGVDHLQTATEVNNLGNGQVEISVKAHRGDVQSVTLQLRDPAREWETPMTVRDTDGAFDYWTCTIQLPGAESSCQYLPVYRDGTATAYLTAGGLGTQEPPLFAWFTFHPAEFPPFTTPDWVKDAVIYQIFVDRFANGDPGNDQDFTEVYYEGRNKLPDSGRTNGEYYHLVTDWYDVSGLTRSPYRTDGKPDYFSFYGGDLAGVEQKLDYLQDLGVTAIYFNPIFEAKSNHKYDCADYLKIDPHFGTNDQFQQFVQNAHQRGIRIILDIVFNHVGNSHWAFREACEQGPSCDTYDWFEFKQWPVPAMFTEGGPKPENYYACWWGFGDLPDLNFDLGRPAAQEHGVKDRSQARPNQPLLDHLHDVVQYWIGDMDCDGVRLDVANEVPFWFWEDFNRQVKSIKPDAYIVGEIWGNAAEWVGPTGFDATMNYAFFRDPATKFLGQGRGTAQEFDRALARGRSAYPRQATQVMMNLLDSHDTVRYRQQVGGDLDRVKLSALFAMTYVGAPHIYYGDEIGMMGGKDPDCRRPFRWNYEQDPERVDLHAYYRALARARAESPALRRGEFTTLHTGGKSYAFLRTLGDERVLVLLNAGLAEDTLPLDTARLGATRGVDLVTGETVTLSGSMAVAGETGMAIRLQ